MGMSAGQLMEHHAKSAVAKEAIYMNQTYIHKNDQQLGPFDDSVILQSLGNGVFDYSDLCWREGWEDWRQLESIYPKPISVEQPPHPASEAPSKEKLMWTGRPSTMNYIGWFIAGVVLAPLFGIGIVLIIYAFLKLRGQKYIITDKKVTLETGIFVKSSNQLRIKDIRSINVTKKGLGGLFLGMGSVELSSAATGKAEVVFEGIRCADKLRDLISELQE